MSLAKENKIQLNHAVEIMRLTLTFDGSLPSGSNDPRVQDKQIIRRAFHEQLADLWRTNPALKRRLESWEKPTPENALFGSWVNCFDTGPFRFIPLVTGAHSLLCELDILFLRAEPPGRVFTTNFAGDLDNRLKVLFDALRMPREAKELPASDLPAANENPFFCLLEHDSMISTVRIESERLYGTAGPDARVRLVVRARILITEVTDGMTLAIILQSA